MRVCVRFRPARSSRTEGSTAVVPSMDAGRLVGMPLRQQREFIQVKHNCSPKVGLPMALPMALPPNSVPHNHS